MTGYEVRQALRAGKRVYSTCVTAYSQRVNRSIAALGIDFVFIDSEHTALGRGALASACSLFAGLGIPPVVRIPSPDPYEACKVLDGGASGFIGPYTETVAQAQGLAGAARYRPLKGQRLQNALEDPSSLEDQLRTYLEERNRDTILILNIESVPAMENLDNILSVAGIDAVLIGPHDLSCSLGIPEEYDHPRFDAAVREIISKAREHNVGAGIHYWQSMEQEVAWGQHGANLIMHSADAAIIRKALESDFAQLRSALGDAGPVASGDDDVV